MIEFVILGVRWSMISHEMAPLLRVQHDWKRIDFSTLNHTLPCISLLFFIPSTSVSIYNPQLIGT
jgi:hypothetical protein